MENNENDIKQERGKYFPQLLILITAFILFLYFISSWDTTDDIDSSNIVEIYYIDDITDAHKIVIRKFNELYEGQIRVVPVNVPFARFNTNEREELLARSFRSKSDRVDIYSVDPAWSKRFAKWAEPLEEYLDPEIRQDLMQENLVTCISESDELFAAPHVMVMGVLHYRDDLLRNIPRYDYWTSKLQSSITWKEFLTLSKECSSRNGYFYIFPADDYEGLVCSFLETLLCLDPQFYDQDEVNYDSDEIKKVLRLFRNMIYTYKLVPPNVVDYTEYQSEQYFFHNDVLFIRSWPNFFRSHRQQDYAPEKYSETISYAPLPHFEGQEPRSILGGWNIIISKFSQHKKEASLFLNYVLGEEAQKLFFQLGGFLPVRKSLYNDSAYVAQHPELLFYKEYLKYGVHRPQYENYTSISSVISYFVNKALMNEISIEEASKKMNDIIHSKETIFH